MTLSLCFGWSFRRIKKIGEDLMLLPWGFLQSFQFHFGLLTCSQYHWYFQIWYESNAEPASEQAAPWEQAGAYLFDGVQEAPVAVHHHRHGDNQAEDEETDDVGGGLSWLWGPAYRTACACTFHPITAPAEQGWHGPDQGINPRATHGQQSLAEIVAALVAQGEGAVALIGQHGQGDQGHDACNEPSNTKSYFHYFACLHSKSQESRWFFFFLLLYIWSNSENYFHYSLYVKTHWSWLLCPSCQIFLTQIYLTLEHFYTWEIFIF